jgi:hypothetical protein
MAGAVVVKEYGDHYGFRPRRHKRILSGPDNSEI